MKTRLIETREMPFTKAQALFYQVLDRAGDGGKWQMTGRKDIIQLATGERFIFEVFSNGMKVTAELFAN